MPSPTSDAFSEPEEVVHTSPKSQIPPPMPQGFSPNSSLWSPFSDDNPEVSPDDVVASREAAPVGQHRIPPKYADIRIRPQVNPDDVVTFGIPAWNKGGNWVVGSWRSRAAALLLRRELFQDGFAPPGED